MTFFQAAVSVLGVAIGSTDGKEEPYMGPTDALLLGPHVGIHAATEAWNVWTTCKIQA